MKKAIEILSVICLVVATYYLTEEDTARVIFWMGLAVYNHITANCIYKAWYND